MGGGAPLLVLGILLDSMNQASPAVTGISRE